MNIETLVFKKVDFKPVSERKCHRLEAFFTQVKIEVRLKSSP